eukprot:1161718-Pelagomonas_calceolata.AAC.5
MFPAFAAFDIVPEHGATHTDTSALAVTTGRHSAGEGSPFNNGGHHVTSESHHFNNERPHVSSEDHDLKGESRHSDEQQLSCAISDGPSEATSDSHPSPLDICRYRSRPHQTPQQQQRQKPALEHTHQVYHQLLDNNNNNNDNSMHDSSASLPDPRQRARQQQPQLVLGQPRQGYHADAGNSCGATPSDSSHHGTAMEGGPSGVTGFVTQQQQQGKGSSKSRHPQRSSIDVACLLHQNMHAGCCPSWDGAGEEHGENCLDVDNDEGDDARRELDQVCQVLFGSRCCLGAGVVWEQVSQVLPGLGMGEGNDVGGGWPASSVLLPGS